MAQKIYQVEIKAVYADGDETTFKTFLFTDKENAKACVNQLYNKRFESTVDWYSNPFSDYEEDEQNKVTENITIEGKMVVKFELYEDFDCSELSVMIVEKSVDLDCGHWEF